MASPQVKAEWIVVCCVLTLSVPEFPRLSLLIVNLVSTHVSVRRCSLFSSAHSGVAEGGRLMQSFYSRLTRRDIRADLGMVLEARLRGCLALDSSTGLGIAP